MTIARDNKIYTINYIDEDFTARCVCVVVKNREARRFSQLIKRGELETIKQQFHTFNHTLGHCASGELPSAISIGETTSD